MQVVTGQLYLSDGIVQEIPPGFVVPGLLSHAPGPRTARGRDRDFLFAHLTLTGNPAGEDELIKNLLRALSNKFYSASGSVTAALRAAVLEVNEQLLRHNLSQSQGSREGAITCTVFRQEELFTLQVGESLALLGHNYGIERLPPKTPAEVTPLGRSRGIDIRYYHHRLQSGDILLLADPRISHMATEEFRPALVESDVETGLEQLAAVIGEDSVRLLLIEFSSEAPLHIPDANQPLSAAAAAVVPPPQPRRETAVTPKPAAAERQPQPSRSYSSRQEPIRSADGNGATGGTAVDREQVEIHARRAGSSAALGASQFTAWLADFMARLRPPRTAEDESVNWAGAAVLALIIPIIVAIVVTGVYVARDQAQLLSDVKIEMGEKLLLAESAATEAESRQHYLDILTLADEAGSELRPGDPEVIRIRDISRNELDKLESVTRLSTQPFFQYSEGTYLESVTLREDANGGIFTIDSGNGLVYEHETNETYSELQSEEPFRLLFQGQSVGNHVVGTIIDFIWRPQGFAVQREGLALLDRDGSLLTFQPSLNSTFAVPLDLSIDWVNPVAVTDFDERIYILDTGAEQIWKYFPDGEDFIAKADERAIVFTEDPDLINAVDFDIYSEDGSLVILYGDGRIRYYDTRNGRLEWDETTMLANGLKFPLKNPSSVKIVGRGLNATVYVADAGNGRIVQVSRPTGQVLAQYRATAADGEELFTGITDFAIVELPLRLFVTKEDTLHLATQE